METWLDLAEEMVVLATCIFYTRLATRIQFRYEYCNPERAKDFADAKYGDCPFIRVFPSAMKWTPI